MKELPSPTFSLSPIALPRGLLDSSVQLPHAEPATTPLASAIEVSWARNLDEVRAAQRLRYQVFAVEMGARLDTKLPGHDVDLFDDYCEHLLVRDQATQ